MRVAFIILVLAFASCETSAATVSFNPENMDEEFEVINKEIIDEQDHGEHINLAGSGIVAIPKLFVRSSNIRSISLANNRIEHIPADAFHGVPNLLHLNLSGNGIPLQKLFSFGHQRLRMLVLSYQTAERYTDEQFNRMRIGEFLQPELRTSFPNLEYLDLSGNNFPSLPINFNESFPRLMHLYLADRKIMDVAEELFELLPPTLKSLHLDRNSITRIYFSNLANIEELYLDRNAYLTGIEYLYGRNLKLLSLSGCSLRSINISTFIDVPQLTVLDLSDNLISFIPSEAISPLTSLKRLDLSRNRLMTFPNLMSIKNLHTLLLSYNQITSVTNIIPFPLLKRLSLRGNQISAIAPQVFSNLFSLEELDLSKNQLTSLPENWMSGMQLLRYLNLKFNSFASIIEMNISRSLKDLEIYVKSKVLTSIEMQHLQLLPDRYIIHVI